MKSTATKIKAVIATGLLLLGLTALPLAYEQSVFADAKSELCSGAGIGTNCANTGNQSVQTILKNVVNLLIFVTGAVSVIFIIIGGLRYVTSNGDQSQVTAAKNTIMYAVIGLVVAIAAYGIVAFVVGKLG